MNISATSRDGSHTKFQIPRMTNIKDPMDLLASLWTTEPIRRKRQVNESSQPTEQDKTLIDQGKFRNPTAEEVEELLKRQKMEEEMNRNAQGDKEKKDETPAEKKDDETSQIPAEKEGKDVEKDPKLDENKDDKKEETNLDQKTDQKNKELDKKDDKKNEKKDDKKEDKETDKKDDKKDDKTDKKIDKKDDKADKKNDEILKKIDLFISKTDKIFTNLAKQASTIGKDLADSINSKQSLLIESNEKSSKLLSDSVKSVKSDTFKIADESAKMSALLYESNQIHKKHAADAKRLANQGNVRSFSLGQSQEQYTKYGYSFDYDPLLQRIVLNLNKSLLSQLILSPDLAYICGFSESLENITITESKTIASFPINMNNNLENMWVYADCVRPRIVGHTKLPLLRVIPVSNEPYASTISTIFNPIQYLPISVECLDSIQIRIKDERGNPIKFSFGSTIIILHFIKD